MKYGLCQAHQFVQSAFGSKYLKLQLEPKVVKSIVMACVILHNVLQNKVGQNAPDDQQGTRRGNAIGQ